MPIADVASIHLALIHANSPRKTTKMSLIVYCDDGTLQAVEECAVNGDTVVGSRVLFQDNTQEDGLQSGFIVTIDPNSESVDAAKRAIADPMQFYKLIMAGKEMKRLWERHRCLAQNLSAAAASNSVEPLRSTSKAGSASSGKSAPKCNMASAPNIRPMPDPPETELVSRAAVTAPKASTPPPPHRPPASTTTHRSAPILPKPDPASAVVENVCSAVEQPPLPTCQVCQCPQQHEPIPAPRKLSIDLLEQLSGKLSEAKFKWQKAPHAPPARQPVRKHPPNKKPASEYDIAGRLHFIEKSLQSLDKDSSLWEKVREVEQRAIDITHKLDALREYTAECRCGNINFRLILPLGDTVDEIAHSAEFIDAFEKAFNQFHSTPYRDHLRQAIKAMLAVFSLEDLQERAVGNAILDYGLGDISSPAEQREMQLYGKAGKRQLNGHRLHGIFRALSARYYHALEQPGELEPCDEAPNVDALLNRMRQFVDIRKGDDATTWRQIIQDAKRQREEAALAAKLATADPKADTKSAEKAASEKKRELDAIQTTIDVVTLEKAAPKVVTAQKKSVAAQKAPAKVPPSQKAAMTPANASTTKATPKRKGKKRCPKVTSMSSSSSSASDGDTSADDDYDPSSEEKIRRRLRTRIDSETDAHGTKKADQTVGAKTSEQVVAAIAAAPPPKRSAAIKAANDLITAPGNTAPLSKKATAAPRARRGRAKR